MARQARVVIPGLPHLVTQAAGAGMVLFADARDSLSYIRLMAACCAAAGTECLGYCLLPDRVHLILTPRREDGLRGSVGEAHRRYSRLVNGRRGATGGLWRQRFASSPLDGHFLLACLRYIERLPVERGLAARPEHWRWSSAKAHMTGWDDRLVRTAPLRERVADWRLFLDDPLPEADRQRIVSGMYTGRPMGSERFVADLERRTGRRLNPRKRGPKPAAGPAVARQSNAAGDTAAG